VDISVRLDFGSPTYFAQNSTHVITPDPRLIVGSWRRHWNTHADPGLQIPDEAAHTLTQSLRLTEFNLSTERRDSGYGHTRPGFTGAATIRLDKTAPAETRAQFTALSRYATFTGTGAQTTHGFGATTTTFIPARPDLRTELEAPATMTPAASA
jgi:CRISPR-associated endoribonuclease Cas6